MNDIAKMTDMNNYVRHVYGEMSHYIIIGLTGRCGSGCSTTRDILCGDRKFNPEDYMGSIRREPEQNADRDQNIILNFAESNPLQFEAIMVRDILTSYILEKPDVFFDILNQVFVQLRGDGKKLRKISIIILILRLGYIGIMIILLMKFQKRVGRYGKK